LCAEGRAHWWRWWCAISSQRAAAPRRRAAARVAVTTAGHKRRRAAQEVGVRMLVWRPLRQRAGAGRGRTCGRCGTVAVRGRWACVPSGKRRVKGVFGEPAHGTPHRSQDEFEPIERVWGPK
jgi:hypothetical protein